MNDRLWNIIKCPKCNWEYLPGELFEPNYFLGKPTNIIRDEKGSIITFEGIEQNLEENYICDRCSTPFKIKANLNYEVELEDISDEYVVSLYNDRISLKEE